MNVPGRAAWRSIAGRLYVALGLTLAGLIVTNVHTVVYAHFVADSARSIATISIDGVRAADDFDDLLDQHRRTVTDAVDKPGAPSTARILARLAEIERNLAENPALSAADGAPSPEIVMALRKGVEDLGMLARTAVRTGGGSATRSEMPAAEDAYVSRVNAMEPVVTEWKTQMREATAAALTVMNARATLMQQLQLALMAAGCAIGTMAALISRGMLSRLRRLTGAMLSLAGGNLETEIPYRGDHDELGRLADALDVFRDNAGRVLANEVNLSGAFENMVEAILMFSPGWIAVLHNQNAVRMFGLPCRDCRGMTAPDMLEHLQTQGWPGDIVKELEERLAGIQGREEGEAFDISLPDGRSFTVTAAVLPNRHLLVSMEDTSERRASAARIAHLAHHDTLTELPNRAMFQERLSAAVEDALGDGGIGVALLVCDLDRFKEVNDTYGHPAGDELLCQVAQRMRDTMRKTDVLARLGGDEFAIVHLIGRDPEEAYAVAERIVSTLTQPFEIQGNKVCIGVSVGIARAPVDATNLSDLMKRADLALYAAKQGGRNRFVAYDATMAERLEERRIIAIEMRKVLDSDGFHLCYQPQVDLRTRRILGFEALARWTHPVRGPIGPATFIPIAEESGLIVQLGEWALQTACREAVGWGSEIRVSVNVSPQQLHEEGFVDTVRSVLHETGLPPGRLELEVTETAMLNDGDRMMAVLENLRAIGVHLALDDFGTGYSALSYLQKFPFDKIKIDQSFVRQLGDKDESDAIVRAVAGLGVNLGIRTIAEGIETEDQAERILGASCDEGQGYLFSRPVPASAVREMLAEQEVPAYRLRTG